MAAGAGVRRAGAGGEVRPRHLEAVIVARVDHHVGLGRHVAVDALAAGLARRVVVVLGHVERAGQVALAADGVALGAQLQAVRLVAVRSR